MVPAVMAFAFNAILFATALFGAVLGLMEFGRRWGKRRIALEAEGARAGLGVVDGAVFSLLGLLIAFTFSGAAARFDNRRALILAEANAIGTAWLRIDLLPAADQPPLRDLFRRYLDDRVAVFRLLPDIAASRAALDRANRSQGEIWTRSVTACQSEAGRGLVMPWLGALNAMFDCATSRTEALYWHPPIIVFLLLGGLSMISALLAGYGMAGAHRRSWLHMVGFAAILAVTVFVTIDLELPRAGMIQVDDADRVLLELRQSMGPVGK